MPPIRTLLTVATVCVLLALVVPTAAITMGEDQASNDVVFEPTDDQYASVEDGEIKLDLERFNDRAVTRADDVFTITVTDDDIERIWIDHDVPGLTFYEGSNLTETISKSNPLEPSADETMSIGVAADTHESMGGTGTFTVTVQYEDGEYEPRPTPMIEGTKATVSPTSLEAGGTVTVNATYRNEGEKTGAVTSHLTIDGTIVDQRTLELEPGETKSAVFERTMYWPGTFDVGIDGTTSQRVTVEGPPIEVVNASTEDSSITAGESSTVRATVHNPTDMPVKRTLEVAVDGTVVDSRAVSVPANGERTVRFERRFGEPGTYEIAVSGISAGTVTVDEPGAFSVRNRELSVATTAALAPPATGGLLFLAIAANRRWTFLR